MEKISLPCIFVGLYMAVCLFNGNYMSDMLGRKFVSASSQRVSEFSDTIDKMSILEENDGVMLICQEDNGYTKIALTYHLYPIDIEPYIPYSITAGEQPLYEGDIWTQTNYTIENFIENLKVHNCNYVFLANLNNRFYEEYSSIFESAEDIRGNSLYKFDSNTNKLTLVL